MSTYLYFDDIPLGCGLLPVTNDHCEPHLFERDLAVVDYTARDLVFGEIVVVRYQSGFSLWEIVPSRKGWNGCLVNHDGSPVTEPVYWFVKPNRPRGNVDLDAWMADRKKRGRDLYLTTDGPIKESGLLPMLVGRVIGIYKPERVIRVPAGMPAWLSPPIDKPAEL